MGPTTFDSAPRVGRPWLPLLFVAGLCLASAGCQVGANSESAAAQPEAADATAPPTVDLVTVEPQPWPRTIRVSGSLLGDEHAVIGAKVAGRIDRVPVDLGARVVAGDVLASLDTERLDLQVREAEAQLEQTRVKLGLQPGGNEEGLDRTRVPTILQEQALRNQARATLARSRSLAPQNIVTAEELEQCQADLEVAEARYRSALNAVEEQIAVVGVRRAVLALAKQERDDAEVRAPFAGCVEQRHVAPGVFVQVGEPIVTLVRTDPLRFRAGVPERQASLLREQQQATIRVEGEPEPLPGKVSRLSPALDMASRSLTMEIDLPNPGGRLRVGLFAEAEVVVDPEARTLAIPAGAVREFAGVEKVWVVKDGQAEDRVIGTGRRLGEQIEVLRGLAVGEQVIRTARDGRAGPVVVREPPAAAPAPADSGGTPRAVAG